MARVGWTLALSLLIGGTLAVAGVARAQQPTAAPEAKPEPAAKKKAAVKKDAKAGAESGEAAKTAAKPREAADVDKAIDGAQKSLDVGKADLAVTQMNALISGGGLDARGMARALALRGHAYRRQGKSAQAISDLQGALYFKGGLNDAERAAASQARTEAYREAGLGEAPPVASGGGASPAGGKTVAAKAATVTIDPKAAKAASQVTTATIAPPKPEPAPPATSNGGIGSFFSNMFGGSAAKPAPTPSPVKAPAEPAVSCWSEPTVKAPAKSAAATAAAPKGAVAAVPVAAPSAVAAPKADGKFRLQLEAMRSYAEAQSLAEKVRKQHPALVGDRPFEITEAVFGSMGTFYRARFGPYAEANESKTICATLRQSGFDCMVIAN